MEKPRCKECGVPLDPLTGHRCRYCGEWVCIEHMLPELHHCTGLVRGPTGEGAWFKTFEIKVEPLRPRPRIKLKPSLSSVEVKDLAFSTLALAVAFTILIGRGLLFVEPLGLILIFPVMLAAVVTAFLFHELAHRFTARKMGYWAEYRAWPPGLLLALASAFLGIIFAAPGAVYVEGVMDKRDYGLISLAGPLTNLLLALIFMILIPSLAIPWQMTRYAQYLVTVNLWLGFFNLLPIPPLDGSKIFKWNPLIWVIAIALAVALLLL